MFTRILFLHILLTGMLFAHPPTKPELPRSPSAFLSGVSSLKSTPAKQVNFISMGIPKTGTHLLLKILYLLHGKETPVYPHPDTLKRDTAFFQQNPYDVIFVTVRDPRDVLISAYEFAAETPGAAHVLSGKWDYWAKPLTQNPRWATMTKEERLLEMIKMSPENLIYGILKIHRAYCIVRDGRKSSKVNIIRFEDMVGPQGGGSEEQQVKVIKQIALLSGADKERIPLAIESAWGGENQVGYKTFRQGKIGRWKQVFKKEHVAAFKQYHQWQRLLVDFGYEKDDKWGLN